MGNIEVSVEVSIVEVRMVEETEKEREMYIYQTGTLAYWVLRICSNLNPKRRPWRTLFIYTHNVPTCIE